MDGKQTLGAAEAVLWWPNCISPFLGLQPCPKVSRKLDFTMSVCSQQHRDLEPGSSIHELTGMQKNEGKKHWDIPNYKSYDSPLIPGMLLGRTLQLCEGKAGNHTDMLLLGAAPVLKGAT